MCVSQLASALVNDISYYHRTDLLTGSLLPLDFALRNVSVVLLAARAFRRPLDLLAAGDTAELTSGLHYYLNDVIYVEQVRR